MQSELINTSLIKGAFRVLKTVCDSVVGDPSVENLNKWITVISNIDDVPFSHLCSYAVFPIQYHLCRHNSQNCTLHSSTLCLILHCLKITFIRCPVNSVDQFIQFNKVLTDTVIDNAEKVTLKVLPEDVKYAVIDALCSLNECLTQDVVREIYDCSKKYQFLHAQVVYICTCTAKFENYLNLRVAALKCILVIIRVYGDEKITEIDSNTKANIAETVGSILPGLVSMYYYIVSSSSILHRDLYLLSARIFGACVALVFEANDITEHNEDYLSKLKSMISNKGSCISAMKYSRSEEWCRNTAEKLVLPAKCLLTLCYNSQWKVRLEAANVAKLILSKCDDRYLMPVLSSLFEVLIILSQDRMDEVRTVAERSLFVLLAENTLRREKFFESFKERLFHLLIAITSALNSINENVLLSHLNLLNGYLTILSSRRIFKSSVHLENLILTLAKVVRFDSSTVSSISSSETVFLTDVGRCDNTHSKKICWKNTKHLSDNTEAVVKSICKSIGDNVDIDNLTIYLLDTLEQQPNNRKEIIFLINHIVLNGNLAQSVSNHSQLYRCIIDTYLDHKYWSVPTTFAGEGDCAVSSALIHNNIIQICLLVEGIGNVASCMREEFKPLLLHSLYKIVEKAGCTNEIISLTAIGSLKRISEACGYKNVDELIADNVDYLTNTIIWKLRDLKHNIVVFDVFCVVISFSQENSLSTLLDIVKTLLEGNSLLQDAYSEGFLRVFKSFTLKLRSWFSPIYKDDNSSINESTEKYFQFLLGLSKLVARLKNKNERLLPGNVRRDCDIDLNDIFKDHKFDFMDDEVPDEEAVGEIDQNIEDHIADSDDDSDKVDPHIELIVSVGENILHILPHANVFRKALILDILADILLILSDKENQLLPMVHKIWSPLVNRLKYDNTDPLIMRRCFQMLCIMAVTAGDFIRTRTLKDVLPYITGFLSSSAEYSKLKDKNSVYRTSQKYKLQLMLLSEMGLLAVHMNLQEKELHSILVAATPYLSCRQPLPLQDACINLFFIIKAHQEDLVWIYLMSISPPQSVLKLEHTKHFEPLELSQPENNEEFKKNAIRLLK